MTTTSEPRTGLRRGLFIWQAFGISAGRAVPMWEVVVPLAALAMVLTPRLARRHSLSLEMSDEAA